MRVSWGIFSGLTEHTEDRHCCSLLQLSMQIAHAGGLTVLSPASTSPHGQPLSSKSVTERCPMTVIPNQQHVPTELERAHTN